MPCYKIHIEIPVRNKIQIRPQTNQQREGVPITTSTQDPSPKPSKVKWRLVSPATYRRGLVKRGNILAWLKHLEHAPLYVASGVRIDWSRLGVFDDDDAAVCEGERAQGGDDADDIETVPENIYLDDPVPLAIALNAMSKTIVFNEEGEQRPRVS
ncbi:hypothetical protein MRX96_036372 [Rhipicephalus microplus]